MHVAKLTPDTVHRAERVIAYMMVSVVGLSILSFLAVIIGTFAGMGRADFASGAWPVVAVLPLFGLPFAIILLITLVIVSARRRSREAAQPRKKQGR